MFAHKNFFKSKKFKAIIIGACFFVILFVVCGSALAALELNYPEIPGIGEISEKTIQDKGIGFYAKYIVQMVFFITAGVCLAVVLLGGFFYIAGNQKPAIIQQAQDMVKRGFLGLFIVVTSYLVLNTINPQLLTLKLKIDRLSPPFASIYSTPLVATVTMGVLDSTEIAKEIVFNMQKKVPVNVRGVIVPDTSPDKTETVAMIETPFIRISQLLEEAQMHTQKIAELLKYCKCGQSFNYIAVEGALNAECKEGLEPKEAKKVQEDALAAGFSRDQALCLTQADNCGTKNPVITEDDFNNGSLSCDLREVRNINIGVNKKDVNGKDILDEDGKPILEDPSYEVQVCQLLTGGGTAEELFYGEGTETRCSWEPISSLSPAEQNGLIKYHRERLVYLQSLLSPEGMKLSVEQMVNLENKLKISASGFVLSSNNEGMFERDFQNWRATQEDLVPGIKFVIDLPAQFAVSQEFYRSPLALNNGFTKGNNNFFALIKNGTKKLALRFLAPQTAMAQAIADSLGFSQGLLSSGAIYYIKNVENYNGLYGMVQEQLKDNQDMDTEARRANLFSVLAEMSLEQIDKIFKDCLTSAFGNANYNFSGNVQEIIQQAIKQGTADYAVLVLSQASANFAGLVGDEIIKAINDEADAHLKEKCAIYECKCGTVASGSATDLAKLTLEKKCSNGVAFSDWIGVEANGKCVSDCVRENIPPHFLSNQLAIIATEPLYKRLPDSLQEIFTEKVKDVVFSDEFNAKLDSEMLALYNKVLQGALTTSTESLIPGLKKVLDTKIDDYIKEFNATTSGILHKFLSVNIANLRPFINKNTEKIGKIIAGEVGKGISNEMEGFKTNHPEIFTENKTCKDCIKDSEEGYTYDVGGTCRKATPEEITAGWSENQTCELVDPLDLNSEEETKGIITTDPAYLSKICHNAGYCWTADFEIDNVWEGANKGPEQCVECSSLQFGRIFNSLTTKAGWREIGKAGLRGAVDFTEQFAIALTQTIMHTATAYIQIELEDRVFTKAEPYLKQAIDLQTKLAKFLNSTVEQILPPQMAGILNGNIDQLLANICKFGKPCCDPEPGKTCPAGEGPCTKIDLYSQFSWGGTLTANMPGPGDDYYDDYYKVSEGAIDKVCHFSQHLHTTLLDEIAVSGGGAGETFADIIRGTIIDGICAAADEDPNAVPPKECAVKEWLKKSPADLLFSQYGFSSNEIKALIQGTPKKLLCGELAIIKIGNDVITPTKLCDKLKDEKVKLLGNIPYVSEDKLNNPLLGLSPKEKETYKIYCPFVWAACSNEYINSSNLISGNLGNIAAGFIEQSCDRAEVGAATAHCLGQCRGDFADLIDPAMRDDTNPNCSSAIKDQCRACNFSQKPIIEQMIIGAFNANPVIGTVYQRALDPTRKEKELIMYEWLNISFPAMIEDFHKVAISRGITQAEWGQILKKQRTIEEINNIKNLLDPESDLKVLISACANKDKWSNLLVKVPFGVVKPFKQGEATLLLDADEARGETKNFLQYSIKDLVGKVCQKTKDDFKEKYPNNTFEYLWNKEGGEAVNALRYSMDSLGLDRPIIAKILEKVLNDSLGNEYDGDKIPYVACLSLEYAPYQILGLDQKLIYYLRPAEYQILFALMKDQLAPEERPKILNDAIGVLYGDNPMIVAADLASKITDVDEKAKADKLLAILTTKLIDMPAKGKPAELNYYYGSSNPQGKGNLWTDPLITVLENTVFKGAKVCDGALELNGDILALLRKTPLQILKDNLDVPIPPIPAIPSLMDFLATKVPALGERYVDSVGRLTGLDVAAYNLFEKKQDVDAQIDQWAEKGKQAIQDATDKAFLDAPNFLIQVVSDRLSGIFGGAEGKDLAGKIGGACKPIANDSECDTTKGNIIKETGGKKECCDMGANTVCENKCRLKPSPNVDCNLGEKPTDIGGVAYCCFNDTCDQCRYVSAAVADKDMGNVCKREGEFPSNGTCCKNRVPVPVEGPLLSEAEKTKCCTTVIECVNRKFLDHLELLNEYIVNGPPPF